MHLLIIEDDIDLGLALQSALRPEGFTCRWVRKLADATVAPGPEVDGVLLDLALPDGDDMTLLRRWAIHRHSARQASETSSMGEITLDSRSDIARGRASLLGERAEGAASEAHLRGTRRQ